MSATQAIEGSAVGIRGRSYRAGVRAEDMAEHRLPGIVVTDSSGRPSAVLPTSRVARLLVPTYVQEDPSLAGLLDESMADRAAEKLGGKTVCDVLPDHRNSCTQLQSAPDNVTEVADRTGRKAW